MAEDQAKQRYKKRRPRRPPGSRNKCSRELLPKADGDVTPADVLLGVMGLYWADAQDEKLDAKDRSRARDKACAVAKEAAPYFHAELVATETEHIGELLSELSEESA